MTLDANDLHEFQHSDIGDSSGAGSEELYIDASIAGAAFGGDSGAGGEYPDYAYRNIYGCGSGDENLGSRLGTGYGDGSGNGDMSADGGNPDSDFTNHGFPEEIADLFDSDSWTTLNRILHAYAYMNATSQEERDCILGLLELSEASNE